jgi:Spy/CpxP family protein refolding chaperone
MKLNKILALSVLSVLAIAPVWANEEINVDEKVNMLKTELTLTDEQVNQVKPIIEEYKINREQIDKAKEDQLKAVLTDEQMDKFKEWKKKKHAEHGDAKH